MIRALKLPVAYKSATAVADQHIVDLRVICQEHPGGRATTVRSISFSKELLSYTCMTSVFLHTRPKLPCGSYYSFSTIQLMNFVWDM